MSTEVSADQRLVDQHRAEQISTANAIKAALTVAERRRDDLVAVRARHMKEMHEAGATWVEIGRVFGLTPQAVMYATGYAVRTPKGSKKG